MMNSVMQKVAKQLSIGMAIMLGAISLGASAKPAPRPAAPAAARNWANTISYLPSGAYVRGNPAARVKLVEYISYTCPHCADFNAEAAPAMASSYIASGNVQVEVRPFFRNMYDVAASLLAHCGPADRFKGNHDALLAQQKHWLAPAEHPTSAQIERWSNPDFATRMQAVAGDLGLTRIMQGRGYSPAQLGACLADKALAQKLADLTEQAVTTYKVTGTPSFMINNTLQADTFSWPALRPKIDQALR
ncbi:MAG: hypothetical protein RLZZ84_809 [Pseudomonadota bacterium]|jgi:protein-disulfide isomerase